MQQYGVADHDYMQMYPISYGDFLKVAQHIVSAALPIAYSKLKSNKKLFGNRAYKNV